MNMLLEQNLLAEMNCGSNYTCILNDNALFLPTEYKVLQSQNNSCFVKCMKMLFNGQIQFYYLTSQYQTFSGLLNTLTPDSFLAIVTNLIANIIDVKNNGFLSCLNINTDFDHIYIDAANYQVKLIYIPTSRKVFSDNAQFENELRTNLIKIISKTSSLSSSKNIQLMQDLSNGMLSMEDLYKRIKGNQNVQVERPGITPEQRTPSVGSCKIISIGAAIPLTIDVNKDEFVIGKKAEVVDGVISFNKMISRIHCKIVKKNDGFSVVDLRSANGTYVNRVRLQPEMPYPINNGDILKLANSEFKVQIG